MTRIGTGFVDVDANMAPFWRTINAEMARLQTRTATINIGASTGPARLAIDRLVRDASKRTIQVKVDTSQLNRALKGATAGVGGLGSTLGGASGGLSAFRIGLLALIPVTIAFGGAAIAATSALGPLIGLAAAAGTALGAAATGFGVFKLATSGVADALTEQAAGFAGVGGAAASSAGQQRAAARAIEQAQDGVKQAIDGVSEAEHELARAKKEARKAERDLAGARTEARRALVDMRAALVDTALSEARATDALQDARRALTELDAGVSQDDLAAGSRTVTEALHAQEQSVLSLRRAQESLDQLLGRAASSEQRRAATAAALARAQDNLATVERDSTATYDERTHALQLVASATKAANDASAAAATSETDKAQALLDVAQAQDAVVAAQANAAASQKALANLNAGPGEEERQRALLDVLEAEQRLAETQRDRVRQAKELAAAEKAGVDGSAQVLAVREAMGQADERVRAAEDALVDSREDVKRATVALSDAQASANDKMSAGAAAAANMNAKFDALPAAAQTFVRQLLAMRPLLTDLRAVAASGFFPGAGAGLAAAAQNFEPVKRVVAATAGVLGDLARRAGELVGSAGFGHDLETIGLRNARVIDTLGDALLHVVSAVRHVMVAAGPLTQWLADVAAKWARNADGAARAGVESGRLAAFFEKTRAITERLASITGHLASALLGVGKVGSKSGNEIWAAIDRAAARFDKWANSAGGKKQLQQFFEDTKELAAAIVPAFANVAKAVGLLSLRFLPLTAALKVLGPYVDEAVIAFVAYKVAMFAAAAAQAIYNVAMLTSIGRAIIWRATLLASVIATYAVAAAQAVWTAAQWALNAALNANPIGLVVLAIAALVGGLIVAWKHSETFRNIVTGCWTAIKRAAAPVIDWLVTAVGDAWAWVKQATTDAWEAIGPIVQVAWEAVKTYVETYVAIISAVVETAWSAIKKVFEVYWPLYSAIVGAALDAIWTVVSTVVTAVLTFLGAQWSAVKAVTKAAWDVIKALIINPIRAALDALGPIASSIWAALKSGWETVKSGTATAWEFVNDKILGPIRAARDAVKGVVDGIANRVEAGWDAITKGAESFAAGLKDAITTAFRGAVNEVIGFINQIIRAINRFPFIGADLKEIAKIGVSQDRQQADRQDAQGLYRGGVVSRPMAIVGEEAPRHPEFVVPTNPAYRGRAVALTHQLMGELGMDGVPGYAIGGILGDAIGGAWDLLKGGAGSLLKMLPTNSLPDWLAGTASGLLDRAGQWIKKQVADLFGGGGDGPLSKLGPMMKRATEIDRAGFPYVYGGGHGGDFAGPYDCSGAVSAILAAGKLISAPLTTDGLKVFGEGGGGQAVTIGVRGSTGRNAHTMMKLAGRYFESGSGHGAQFVDGWSGNFPIHRHPAALAMGGRVQDVMTTLFPPEQVGWGLRMGGVLMDGAPPYRGSFGDGGIVPGPLGSAALVTAHGGEAVTADGAALIASNNRLAAELEALRMRGVSVVTLSERVGGHLGDRATQRRMTAGNPNVTALLP